MALILVAIFALLAFASQIRGQIDWCTVTCPAGTTHTMCLYKTNNTGSACGSKVIVTSMKPDNRRLVTELHNQLRQKVANGNQSPQPKASDMMELKYDLTLELVAQRLALQCVYQHDACRALPDTSVGQNIATKTVSSSNPSSLTLDVNSFINSSTYLWYNEVQNCDTSNVDYYNNSATPVGSVVGHYTQLVWGKTQRIGCGVIEWWSSTTALKAFIVCNYAPAGNYLKTKMYTRGTPCTACPTGTSCSQSYSGLCNNATRINQYS